ncbi:hypothetical protein PV325_003660, partial [Microctonus aethiopoides]
MSAQQRQRRRRPYPSRARYTFVAAILSVVRHAATALGYKREVGLARGGEGRDYSHQPKNADWNGPKQKRLARTICGWYPSSGIKYYPTSEHLHHHQQQRISIMSLQGLTAKSVDERAGFRKAEAHSKF